MKDDDHRLTYTDAPITKKEIFYYVYAILHHPVYRDRYAANLKRELPRIPFAPDFHDFADAGQELARFHLNYESLEPWPLEFTEKKGVPYSERVTRFEAQQRSNEHPGQRGFDTRGHPA